ncbi:MAG: DUF2480 family protein [bacterium]|nr:DUF2480 family protein [bacterium]MBK8131146.1 DUF2480 family protein [bacterium]
MELIRFPLEDLLGDGIVRESDYRQALNGLDLAPYSNQAVMIPWIHGRELPIWVYLMAVAHLTPVAGGLSFGEPCSPVVLTQKRRTDGPTE